MHIKKILFALALAALALVSCNGKDDINGGDYATVTMGGQTWTKAEIITYSHFIQTDEMTFNLTLDADTKRTTTGHLTYYMSPQKVEFMISGGYHSSMRDGAMSVTQVDDKHFILNFEGTDVDGNQFVVKGKASKQ